MKKLVKFDFSIYEVNNIANNTKQFGLMFSQVSPHCLSITQQLTHSRSAKSSHRQFTLVSFPQRARISHVLSDLLRLRCPGFLAIPVTAGTVSLPSVDGSIARLLFHDFAAVETVLVVCFLFVG